MHAWWQLWPQSGWEINNALFPFFDGWSNDVKLESWDDVICDASRFSHSLSHHHIRVHTYQLFKKDTMLLHANNPRSPSSLTSLNMSSDTLKFRDPDRMAKIPFQSSFHSSYRTPRVSKYLYLFLHGNYFSIGIFNSNQTNEWINLIILIILQSVQ